jgi:hypothetical protein
MMDPDRFYLVAPAEFDCCSAISGIPPFSRGSPLTVGIRPMRAGGNLGGL